MGGFRIVPNTPVRYGGLRAVGGTTWGPGEKRDTNPKPQDALSRIAWHGGSVIGFSGGATAGIGTDRYGQIALAQSTRILTDEDCQLIYQRCSDVRAAINSVSWRVATADWDVVPTCPPTDPEHEDAVAECDALRTWLQHPTPDDVWQEVWTAVVADALKFPAGVVELVTDGKGKNWIVDEMVPVRGANFHPICDERGRLIQYVQFPMSLSVPGAPPEVLLDADRVLYLRIAATTEGREPIPLLEALVYEIMALLHGNETIAKSLSSNEVPEGILVLVGVAKDAAERARQQYEGNAGQPWKLRLLTSPDPGNVDAKWVEFRKSAKELDTAELVKAIRRAVWRVFGVQPVEMGETETTPRATAEVQLDAGASHLITPFLDLLEMKLNVEVLPRRTQRKDVQFRFKRARDLSPAERVQKSQELANYVSAGLLTRNESRQKMPEPMDPVENGDVMTVDSGTARPLARLLEAPAPVPTPLAGTDEDAPGEAENPEAEEDAEADNDEAPEDDNAERKRRAMRRQREHKHSHAHRSLRDEVIPPMWRKDGPFKGLRTLPLERLWDEVIGYQSDVLPLWEQARASIVMAIGRTYVAEGFDAGKRSEVERVVAEETDKLLAGWILATSPRYNRVAEDARVRAGDWTGLTDGADVVRQRADLYRIRAMGYLTDSDGLLTDLRMRLILLLTAVTDVRVKNLNPKIRPSAEVGRAVVASRRARRAIGIGPDATVAAVMAAAAAVFDSLRHRVGNWAAKLIDLASETLSSEVLAGSGTGRADGVEGAAEPVAGSVDWWCEWVNVGDEASCETCLDMGSAGFVRVADLRVHPGGGTECRANCRCVLTFWTKTEIDGGTANLLGGGNTGRPL